MPNNLTLNLVKKEQTSQIEYFHDCNPLNILVFERNLLILDKNYFPFNIITNNNTGYII